MIISLIGYRGTGKTTVGRLMAEQLAIPFLDSNQQIVERAGRSIAEIFESEGESTFRDLESEVCSEMMQRHSAVLSWGGGVILRENNRQAISGSNVTFWLQATEGTIFHRIHGDSRSKENRPALTELDPLQEIRTNLEHRRAFYDECCDHVIATDSLSSAQVADSLLIWINRQP